MIVVRLNSSDLRMLFAGPRVSAPREAGDVDLGVLIVNPLIDGCSLNPAGISVAPTGLSNVRTGPMLGAES